MRGEWKDTEWDYASMWIGDYLNDGDPAKDVVHVSIFYRLSPLSRLTLCGLDVYRMANGWIGATDHEAGPQEDRVNCPECRRVLGFSTPKLEVPDLNLSTLDVADSSFTEKLLDTLSKPGIDLSVEKEEAVLMRFGADGTYSLPRSAFELLDGDLLPLTSVWSASIILHDGLGHTEPWEICPVDDEGIAGRMIQEALRVWPLHEGADT